MSDTVERSAPRLRIERAMSLTNGEPVPQYAERAAARSCSYAGCDTRLSRYNPNQLCSQHGGWLDGNHRRNRDLL